MDITEKIIRWADKDKKEIEIEEIKPVKRRLTLENLQRDLETARRHAARAQKVVEDLEAEIAEIKATLKIR